MASMNPDGSWRTEAERQLGCPISNLTRLHGGDFAASFKAVLDDGRTVFVKTHSNPPRSFFSTEAVGLGGLAKSNTICVPEILAVSDHPALLALEWIEQGSPKADTDEVFGRELAQLHRSDFPSFGRPDGMTTGSQAMDNASCETWTEFYAERRLLPLSERAATLGALSAETCNRIQQLASLEAYDEAFPVAPGWQHRVPLYQLATLIVHAIKFGGSYKSAVRAAVEHYV